MIEEQPQTDAHHHRPEPQFSETKLVHFASGVFLKIEQLIYIALGVILVCTALIALAGASQLLLANLHDWTGTDGVIAIMDRLLFVLMLIEILYTIRVSLQSGSLSAEPFLIVALIASIRRVLVISLKSSDIGQPGKWSEEQGHFFQASMIELGVLAMLIIVMVGAIYFVHKR